MAEVRDVTDCIDTSKAEWWSHLEDDDHMHCDDPFDALYDYLSGGDWVEPLPDEIALYGFNRIDEEAEADEDGYWPCEKTEILRVNWREWAKKNEPDLYEELIACDLPQSATAP